MWKFGAGINSANYLPIKEKNSTMVLTCIPSHKKEGDFDVEFIADLLEP